MRPSVPLIVFLGRVAYQKGVHLLLDCVPSLLQSCAGRVQLLVCGLADPSDAYAQRCAAQMRQLRHAYPSQFWAAPHQYFDQGPLASVGADFGLMPSLYEPSGLVREEFFAAGDCRAIDPLAADAPPLLLSLSASASPSQPTLPIAPLFRPSLLSTPLLTPPQALRSSAPPPAACASESSPLTSAQPPAPACSSRRIRTARCSRHCSAPSCCTHSRTTTQLSAPTPTPQHVTWRTRHGTGSARSSGCSPARSPRSSSRRSNRRRSNCSVARHRTRRRSRSSHSSAHRHRRWFEKYITMLLAREKVSSLFCRGTLIWCDYNDPLL